MKYIELHYKDGKSFWINIQSIESFTPATDNEDGVNTHIYTIGSGETYYAVKETIEEIIERLED